ncbi:hypothetical protein C1H46_012244 [Malus baccata]|uniref:Uncharacterized protein n=1 Tax=Malus baccata TaxID=106549 RepID=A0A540MTI2_MALBA|nr:hypothetical protein C1H46_012244 [Malus baccata]
MPKSSRAFKHRHNRKRKKPTLLNISFQSTEIAMILQNPPPGAVLLKFKDLENSGDRSADSYNMQTAPGLSNIVMHWDGSSGSWGISAS